MIGGGTRCMLPHLSGVQALCPVPRECSRGIKLAVDYEYLVLYILADLISFLEIQRLQLAGSSSTVFAVNLILYDE